MPLGRAVYDHDWELLKIHHREAFLAVAYNAYLLKWNRPATQLDSLYDEATTATFDAPVTVQCTVSFKVTSEMMKLHGITERPDAMFYFSTVLLEDASLTIDNRDRIQMDGQDYDILSTFVHADMGDRSVELQVSARRVK